MAQKSNQSNFDKSNISEGIGSMVSAVTQFIFASIKENVLDGVDAILDSVKEHILSTQRRLLRHLIIVAFVVVSLISLLLSLCFYMTDVLHWQRYAIFLVLGAVLLIIATIRAILPA